MALFGFGKEKREGGNADLVLAYLEDAQRVRSPFLVRDGRKLDLPGTLQSLDEEAGTLQFQVTGTYAGDKGAKVEFILIHEGLRIGAATRLVEVRGSTVVMEIPDELELMERRKQARARLNPKEGATLTGLSSLFEGVGITGILENISELGCRVRVEKAMNIKDQKKLGLGTALVSVGHSFMILKLNKVPRCPAVMEMAGRVAYIDDTSGLVLGLALDKSDFTAALRSMVSMRAGAMPSTLPPRNRRKAVPESAEESLLPARNERPEKAEPIKPEPPKPELPAEPKPAPEPAPGPGAVPEAPVNRGAPLMRLKKRARSILILSSSGHGAMLRDHFAEEGYGKVCLAVGWDEIVAQLTQSGTHLLLVDTDRPVLESLEMVQRLKEAGLALPAVVLAADEVSRALVIAAQRVGVSHLLVKPYGLDDTLTVLIEQQMGLGQ